MIILYSVQWNKYFASRNANFNMIFARTKWFMYNLATNTVHGFSIFNADIKFSKIIN